MRPRRVRSCFLILIAAGMMITALQLSAAEPESMSEDQALKSMSAIHPIDVHVHVFKTDPAFRLMLEKLNLKIVNILVMDDTLSYRKELQPQIDDAWKLVHSSKGDVSLCTTFDPYKFNDPTFPKEAIRQIERDFKDGAIAVKIWKNIGMEIKDAKGNYIMPDDPKFAPIYATIQSHGKTLMSHVAEPNVAWGPPDPSDPVWSYYKENPQWLVGGKEGFPTKNTILEARDHILQQNPKLLMIGVHLGSMEKDLDGIASRFDRYPNFAIDTAARMEYLMLMPPEKVKAFLLKYQDRVLYGTDLDMTADANVVETIKSWRDTYARDWRYLATDQTIEINGKEIQGLKLPEPVLRKLYRSNALHWIKDISGPAAKR